MSDTDVLIVGGGISGLSVGWWLVQHGLSVEIWDRKQTPGGLIQSERQDGYLMEHAASMVMNDLPEVDFLLQKSALKSKQKTRSDQAAKNRYLVKKGTLHPVPKKILNMLASPLWSVKGKSRLCAELFIPKGKNPNETVSRFIRRRLGNEVLEKAIEPFVAGSLASDPDQAEARAVLPRLTALEQKFGSITAGIFIKKLLGRASAMSPDVFSFEGGMVTLVRGMANTEGLHFQGEHTVCDIVPHHNNAWKVTAQTPQGEKTVAARHVVLSAPSYALAPLLAPLHSEVSGLLGGIDYAPVTVVHTGFCETDIPRPLDGTGFFVPRREQLCISGNLWISATFDDRAPKGRHLLSSYLGGVRLSESIHWDDTRCLDAVMADLDQMLGIKTAPEMLKIVRHKKALPLYHGAFTRRWAMINRHLQHFPTLHIEGNYCGGVSVRDRIARGYSLANHIARTATIALPIKPEILKSRNLPYDQEAVSGI